MKRVILFSFFLSLVLLFQNCSDIGDIKLVSSSGPTSETASGNGTGYGGKLDGVFYHYIPDYRCENHPSPFAKIDYDSSKTESTYTQSKDSQCLSVPSSIPNSTIDLGAFQNKVIGYEEKIFEISTINPDSIPEKLVEIWCVDKWNSPAIEILSTYNSTTKQAQTEFYYLSLPQKTELNPARSTALQAVYLKSNYFDLVVDKSLPGLKSGTFQGQLTIKENMNVQQTLQCRLGGYLDARLWPATAVNYDNYVQSIWNVDNGLFYITSGLSGLSPWAENKLYTFSPNKSEKQILIGNVNNSAGVDHFRFTPDKENLILKAHLDTDATFQLYTKSITNVTSLLLLNDKLLNFSQGVENEINISPDSRYIYYKDGAQESAQDTETWLRVVDTLTGNITQVNHDLPTGSDVAVNEYEVSYPLGKVIYSVGFAYNEIWVSDLLGGGRHKIDLSSILGVNQASPYGRTKYYLGWFLKTNYRWLFKNDRYLVLVAYAYDSPSSGLVFAIDLQDEKIIFSKEISGPTFLSSIDGLPVIGIQTYTGSALPSSNLFLNLTTAKTLSTPTELVDAFKASTNSAERQRSLDLSIAITSNLCAVPNETTLYQVQLDSNTWLVLNRNENNLISIYLLTSATGTCDFINRITLPSEAITVLTSNRSLELNNLISRKIPLLKAQISLDRRSLLMSVKGRLYLIPTNRQTTIEIYTALNQNSTFDEIGFISDKQIFFRGQLIKDSWNQLFIWNLPDTL